MSADELIGRLLLDVAVVVAAAWVFGMLLGRLRQPPVLGEIIGGIVLGPTILGALPGDPSAALFPAAVRGTLAGVGGMGVVLFMFLVGSDLDLPAIRRSQRALVSVSVGSIALPLVIGFGLAAAIHGSHRVVRGHVVGFAPFALFTMTALSITAFPVLVRILMDRGMQKTRLGLIATGSAAIQDGTGWVLLATALTAIKADGAAQLLRISGETVALTLVLLFVARPVLRRLCLRSRSDGALDVQTLTVVTVGLFASAAATQLIGLHSVLGAFLFGLAFPRDEKSNAVASLRQTFSPITMSVLLPVFFLAPGLSVNLRGLDGRDIAEFGLIFVCACVAKMLGAGIGARIGGLGRGDTYQLSILMNTRGLIELIVLNVGLTAGVLDPKLFTEMVLMAILTTMMTGPLLDLVRRRVAAAQPLRGGADSPTDRAGLEPARDGW